MFSLNKKIIDRILKETVPSFQVTSGENKNLGFGFIFYSFMRTLRPQRVVVIGSKAGFSVVNFALGIKDNENTTIDEVECYNVKLKKGDNDAKVYFIDPSFSVERNDPNHWYGIGFWDDENKVKEHWKKFGVEDFVKHFKMTSQDFLKSKECPAEIDFLYVDGDHSFNGVTHDFNKFYRIMKKDGIIMAHDVDPKLKQIDPQTGGYEALSGLDMSKFEVFRLPVFPGLAIVRRI
jgi:predicted O-methyltransferase YrrM